MTQLFGHSATGVRDIRQMVERSNSKRFTNGYRWHKSGTVQTVVVRVDENIDEDDASQHPAEVMERKNGDWQGTGAYVLVRNAGSVAIDKDSRLVAVPVGNAGLCVSRRVRGIMQPFNLGIGALHTAAIDEWQQISGTSFSNFAPAELFAKQMSFASIYSNLTPEDMLESNFMLRAKQRLHAICLGGPLNGDLFPLRDNSTVVNSLTSSADFLARVRLGVQLSCWVPPEGSADRSGIDQYLADGGTVIFVADCNAIRDSATSSGNDLWSEAYDRLYNQANEWLWHVGSVTRINFRTTADRRINNVALPLSGVVACNPYTWLGRSRACPRLFDRAGEIKAQELNRLRGATLDGGQNHLTAFAELNGYWYGTDWFPLTSPSLWPFTNNDNGYLTAAEHVAFSYSFAGRTAWPSLSQYPPNTHQPSLVSSLGPQYSFRKRSDNRFQMAEITRYVTATAEDLPGGGRLIVTTRGTLPWVLQCLQRRVMDGTLNDLTDHMQFTTTGNYLDEQDNTVAWRASGAAQRLPRYSRLPLTRVTQQSGEGIELVFAGGGPFVNAPGALLLQTGPSPDTVPEVRYTAVADILKTNWANVGGGSTNLWPVVAEDAPNDTTLAYSLPGVTTPWVLRLEPVAPLSSAAPAILRVRVAAVDGSGALTGSGSCQATISLVINAGTSITQGTTLLTQHVSLTNSWQTIEFALDTAERQAVMADAGRVCVRIIPDPSGAGCGVSWISLLAGNDETFDAVVVHMNRKFWQLNDNMAACPWARTWQGPHPVFTLRTSPFTLPISTIAYHVDELAAWGFVDAGLLAPANTASDKLDAFGDWREGFCFAAGAGGHGGYQSTLKRLVWQNGNADTPYQKGLSYIRTLQGPLVAFERQEVTSFPVIFQRGRWLKPTEFTVIDDYERSTEFRFEVNVRLWRNLRASCSLKQWQEFDFDGNVGDLFDIETAPNSPPVCIGAGTFAPLKYGISAPYGYQLELGFNGMVGVDISCEHSTEQVAAAFADSYGVAL